MANTINMDMMRILKDTARNAVEGVSIYCGCTWGKDEEPIEWVVNWSAWGDQNPATAREYAAKLMKAADITEMLTGLEMVQVYGRDVALNKLLEEDKDAAINCYENIEMLAKEYVANCDGEALKELLLNR